MLTLEPRILTKFEQEQSGRLPSHFMALALLTLKNHSGNRKSHRLLLKSHIAIVDP